MDHPQDKIDALVAAHPDRLKVYYIVDKPNWAGIFWRGGVGYVTKDVLAKQLPLPSKDSLVMVCGPPGMMEAVSGNKAPDYSQVHGLVDGWAGKGDDVSEGMESGGAGVSDWYGDVGVGVIAGWTGFSRLSLGCELLSAVASCLYY